MEPQTTVRKHRTLADRVGAELELDNWQVNKRARIAGWTAETLRAEIQVPGWRERFAVAVEAGIEPTARLRAAERLATALRNGPRPMAALAFAERLKRINRRLHGTATTYEPHVDGSRLLAGPTGLGKTMAAVCAAERALVARAERAVRAEIAGKCLAPDRAGSAAVTWVSAAALPLARLQQRFGDGEAELVSDAMGAKFLVIDDLGWETARAGAGDVVFEVMRARYDAGRPTLTTTGLEPEQIADRYGDAFLRRLVECRGMAGGVVDLWEGR